MMTGRYLWQAYLDWRDDDVQRESCLNAASFAQRTPTAHISQVLAARSRRGRRALRKEAQRLGIKAAEMHSVE